MIKSRNWPVAAVVFQLALVCAAVLLFAADELRAGSGENYSLPPAQVLLQNARNHLVSEPLSFSGEVRSRSGSGKTREHIGVEITLDFSKTPAIAEYMLTDRFGRHLETLKIERDADAITSLEYRHGPDKEKGALSCLAGRIRETSLTWNDLTLSFLWRSEAKTVGLDTVRGRRCYVIELLPPEAGAGQGLENSPFLVRVWIDTEMYGLLAAEVYDGSGVKVRELSVKSFKKIDDTWIVKDISFRSFPSGDRTVVRIDDLERISDE